MNQRPADPEFEAEREAARRRIRFLMEFWQIKPEDIARAAPPCDGTSAAQDDGPRPPRYRHPVTGDTWDGSGSQPEWLRRALLQEGYTVEELRIADAQAAGN